jgi:hypothetical protein
LANWFRIRIEPNGNTTGTISVILSYKDYTWRLMILIVLMLVI